MNLALQENRALLGSVLALGAAAAYGSSLYVQKVVVTEYAPPLVGATFALLFGMLILTAMVHRHIPADLRKPQNGLTMMALAGLSSSIGVMFSYLSLNHAQVIVVAPISGVAPLISLLLSHIFLKRLERITWRIVVGALMIAGGVVLVTVNTIGSD